MKPDRKVIAGIVGIIAVFLVVMTALFHFGGAAGFGGHGSAGNTEEPSIDGDFQSAVDTAKTVADSGTVSIDFESLQAQNEDIYAWITVPGTTVDYPVLQRKNSDELYDDFYLNHTVDLVEGYPGSIYSQNVNAVDFSDRITVLYGHNMKNESMFGCLKEFEDQDFFDEHDTIQIYTPEEELTYTIFAAVRFSDDLITYCYDPKDQAAAMQYAEDVYNSPGLFRDDVEVSEKDKLLTLSTCVSGDDSARLLIVAVQK